jgi:phosphate transport system substrate-binding protein
MTQKNDTVPLLLAFLITASLIGGGVWWLVQRSGVDLNRLTSGSPASPTSPTTGSPASPPASSGQDFSSVTNVPSGVFNYGGSTTWAPIRLAIDSAVQAARPEFQLRYVNPVGAEPGTGTGIQMLLRNEIAFAQTSRPLLEREIQKAAQVGSPLKQVPVAIDALAVVVNPDLNIPGVTVEQLQDIYLGKIPNWRELGGPDRAIQPFTRPVSAGGTIELFVEQFLKGQPFGATVQTVATTTEALRRLAETPGGIYFASAPEVVPQCKVKPLPIGQTAGAWVPPYREPLVPANQCPPQRNQLNVAAFQTGQYPLTRNLFVVIKQNGQIEQQSGEAYANFLLTEQGQKQIANAGYVKIR